MATIIRNLIIVSTDQLYKLLKNKEELIIKHDQFSHFMLIAEDYFKGCKCFEDVLHALLIKEYNKLSENEEVIDIIRIHFSCDNVKIIKII